MNLANMKYEDALEHGYFRNKETGELVKVIGYQPNPSYVIENEDGVQFPIAVNALTAQNLEPTKTYQVWFTKKELEIIANALETNAVEYLNRATGHEENEAVLCRRWAKENRELLQRFWDMECES